jgi:hypothetical protein
MAEEAGMPNEFPDARIMVALSTEGDDLERGLDKLNPILKEILLGRIRRPEGDPVSADNFGRLTFSQTG